MVYLFHPDTGQFSLIVNGEPVTNPFIQLAAIPSLIVVLVFALIIALLVFMGVGLYVFFGVVFFAFFGVFMLSPYTWPLLLTVFVIIIVVSTGNTNSSHGK